MGIDYGDNLHSLEKNGFRGDKIEVDTLVVKIEKRKK